MKWLFGRLFGCLLIVATSLMMPSCGIDTVEDPDTLADGVVEPTSVLRVVTGAFDVISKINALVGLIMGPANLAKLFGLGGAGTAIDTVEEIRKTLNQLAVDDTMWRVESAAGQLADRENNYIRNKCTWENKKWTRDDDCFLVAVKQLEDAEELYDAASAVFRDIDRSYPKLKEQKLQLIPTMIEAASVMIFAAQEQGVAKRVLPGYYPEDIEAQGDTVRKEAKEVLRALDRAEVQLQQSYRKLCTPITVRVLNGNINFERGYYLEGIYTDHKGIKISSTMRRVVTNTQDSNAFRAAWRLALVEIEDLQNLWAIRYFNRLKKAIFGSKYKATRDKLVELANYGENRYTVNFEWFYNSQPSESLECVRVDEPSDEGSWRDNYFCASRHLGLRWSVLGPISQTNCTRTLEQGDPNNWHDNYICLGTDEFVFSWSKNGPINGLMCTNWKEPGDSQHPWGDNYLCYPRVIAY